MNYQSTNQDTINVRWLNITKVLTKTLPKHHNQALPMHNLDSIKAP